ncbi:MAG: hypothetical protein AAFW68_12150 [Pseudomonadota bacterium]
MDKLSRIVDSEGSIRTDFIAEYEFKTVLVFDIFRGVEADWLAHAITRLANNVMQEIESLSYDDGKIVDEKRLKVTRDSILEYVLDKNLYHTILTDGDLNFVAYFSQYRDFFLICGKSEFLQAAYPVASDTIRFQYFENVKLEAQRGPVDEDHYAKLWEKYLDSSL